MYEKYINTTHIYYKFYQSEYVYSIRVLIYFVSPHQPNHQPTQPATNVILFDVSVHQTFLDYVFKINFILIHI